MIARADELAVTAQSLPLIRRADIEAEAVSVRNRKWWRLKDPVALRFWQLGDEEFFLWSQLESGASLSELQRRFSDRFAPRRIDLRPLQNFLSALHREGLVFSNAANQGATLLSRHEVRQARERWAWVNVLALRFRGVDPTRFLDLLYPAAAWLFLPLVLTAILALNVSALLLAVTQMDEISARLPTASEFLMPTNLLWLSMVLAGAKVLHELGHALTCKHLGGRCHELGFMLLVFSPCLYCNVSDAWMMPSRTRRMAISAAGIVVELTLAAAATWLWWFSEPGFFSTLCLNVMVVCSVNSVLFNGNPLLRYDGYFLLSDYLDLPNLRQASDDWLNRWFDRIVLGVRPAGVHSVLHDRPLIITAYGLLSLVYRWSLTVVIWWFVYDCFSRWRLEFVGLAVVVISAALIVVQSVRNAGKRLEYPWQTGKVRAGRIAIPVVVVLLTLAFLALVPLPRSVISPAVIRPEDYATVYVTLSGKLVRAEKNRAIVQEGDVLAQLEDPELERELVRLVAERDALQQQIENIRRAQLQTSSAGRSGTMSQLPALEEQLIGITERLNEKKKDREQLTIRAPRQGTICAPRAKNSEPSGDLASWEGNPLEPQNLGCFLEAGTVLCQVGEPGKYEAVAVVDQSRITDIQLGQAVQLRLDELPGESLIGRVRGISELRSETAPPELVAKQLLPTSQNLGQPELSGTFYQVEIALKGGPALPFGASGKAKIEVAPETILGRIYRTACSTFQW